MVRLSAEGREGKFMRNEMIKSLWVDVSRKSRKLGVSDHVLFIINLDHCETHICRWIFGMSF